MERLNVEVGRSETGNLVVKYNHKILVNPDYHHFFKHLKIGDLLHNILPLPTFNGFVCVQ